MSIPAPYPGSRRPTQVQSVGPIGNQQSAVDQAQAVNLERLAELIELGIVQSQGQQSQVADIRQGSINALQDRLGTGANPGQSGSGSMWGGGGGSYRASPSAPTAGIPDRVDTSPLMEAAGQRVARPTLPGRSKAPEAPAMVEALRQRPGLGAFNFQPRKRPRPQMPQMPRM